MKRFIQIVVTTLAILIGVACSADPGPEVQAFAPSAPPATPPAWLTIERVQDCSQGCWHAETVIFEDSDVSGGNHHLFVQTREQGGEWARRPFHLAYPTGNDRAISKMPPDWGDLPIWACFSPDQGEQGPYWAYAGDDPARSDVIRGIGLPECQHINVKVVWRYQEQFPTPPTATPTATRTATATVTPIPCPHCDRALFLPVIRR